MQTLDLREVSCPRCFLLAKLALEDIAAGATLELLFSTKEQALDVKNSCSEEGATAHKLEESAEGFWKLMFLKSDN